MHAASHRQPECTVVQTDSDAMKSTISNDVEMQRRVTRISLELYEVSARDALYLRGQRVKALPKPL